MKRSKAIRFRPDRSGREYGHAGVGSGLYRIEVTSGPGGGVKILNQPTPQAFRESVKVGEQNLYQRAKELVGDRDPREHEFSIQMRAMDADKTGGGSRAASIGRPLRLASWEEYARRNHHRWRAEPGRLRST